MENYSCCCKNIDDEKKEKESSIVIMLDLQKTLDGIDDEKAQIFMKQLDTLRIKYNAQKVILNVSSHVYSPDSFIKYLEILHRNLQPGIVLDDATYLSGTFNYETGVTEFINFGYNLKKLTVFEEKYFSIYNVICHGIIDDSVSPSYLKGHKDERPVFIIRPSAKNEGELNKDNLMCHSSLTVGFDGVLEGMSLYLDTVKDIPTSMIVKKQQEELVYLSETDINMLCIERNFSLLLRYVKDGNLDMKLYDIIARELVNAIENNVLNIDELIIIKEIIEELRRHLEINNIHLLCLTNKFNKGE